MANRGKQLDSATLVEMRELYFQNLMTVAEIGKRYNVSPQSVYSRIKREAWPRRPKSDHAKAVNDKIESAAKQKAERVKAQTSVGAKITEANREEMINKAVDQDVQDMNMGLEAARSCLLKAKEMIDSIDVEEGQAPHLKSLCDATRVSVDTIRKIRGLDEKEQEDELGGMSIEQLKAELERIS